jgi:hypothetical protein
MIIIVPKSMSNLDCYLILDGQPGEVFFFQTIYTKIVVFVYSPMELFAQPIPTILYYIDQE